MAQGSLGFSLLSDVKKAKTEKIRGWKKINVASNDGEKMFSSMFCEALLYLIYSKLSISFIT